MGAAEMVKVKRPRSGGRAEKGNPTRLRFAGRRET
jgi:hypothetical protein